MKKKRPGMVHFKKKICKSKYLDDVETSSGRLRKWRRKRTTSLLPPFQFSFNLFLQLGWFSTRPHFAQMNRRQMTLGIEGGSKSWPPMLAVVVAQLVEWSLPLAEVCSSNPVICKKFILNILLPTVLKRRK